MIYNMTRVWSANDAVEMMKQLDVLAGGVVFSSMLLILFMTYIIVMKKQSFKVVVLGASFFMTIVCVYAYIMELIAMNILIIPIILTFASLFLYYFMNG